IGLRGDGARSAPDPRRHGPPQGRGRDGSLATVARHVIKFATPGGRPGEHRARGGNGPMAMAYCVKDKMKVEVQNPVQITMKNGKPALSGTCPKCGTKVFRIGG